MELTKYNRNSILNCSHEGTEESQWFGTFSTTFAIGFPMTLCSPICKEYYR